MKLHTVFITYNRLELTKKAIASYLETVTCEYRIHVVDNGSTDGTVEWMREGAAKEMGFTFCAEPVNRYPGWATNHGWGMLRDWSTTHLHRADNDFIFLPGWCEEVERVFVSQENIGQVGLRTDEEEDFNKINVGGNCVIKRELWDGGLRWDERTWPQIRDKIGPGWTEDSLMSKSVKKVPLPDSEKGHYTWDRVERPCIVPISQESPEDAYYQATWADRGILK